MLMLIFLGAGACLTLLVLLLRLMSLDVVIRRVVTITAIGSVLSVACGMATTTDCVFLAVPLVCATMIMRMIFLAGTRAGTRSARRLGGTDWEAIEMMTLSSLPVPPSGRLGQGVEPK